MSCLLYVFLEDWFVWNIWPSSKWRVQRQTNHGEPHNSFLYALIVASENGYHHELTPLHESQTPPCLQRGSLEAGCHAPAAPDCLIGTFQFTKADKPRQSPRHWYTCSIPTGVSSLLFWKLLGVGVKSRILSLICTHSFSRRMERQPTPTRWADAGLCVKGLQCCPQIPLTWS